MSTPHTDGPASAPADAVARMQAHLRHLYLAAGKPSSRELSKKIVACSHSTIHSVITFKTPVPKWGWTELIVEALGGDIDQFKALWMAADAQSNGYTLAQPPDPAALSLEPGECRGWLDTPEDGDVVGSRIAVRGRVLNLPPEHHLWVGVRVDPAGLLWPKEPEITIDAAGRFEHHIYEGGDPRKIFLCLVLASGAGHLDLEQWAQTGAQTGHYPGLRPALSKLIELAKVVVRYE